MDKQQSGVGSQTQAQVVQQQLQARIALGSTFPVIGGLASHSDDVNAALEEDAARSLETGEGDALALSDADFLAQVARVINLPKLGGVR
jgi:hypothetical protein